MANAPLGAVVRFIHSMGSAKTYTDSNDNELVKRFLTDNDEKAFVTLLRRHGPMVLGVGRRVLLNEQDAEDILQATFLLLARKARSIRKHNSIASWLYGVAHRLALNMKRLGANRQVRERQAADMSKKPQVSDEAWQELQSALDEALAQLPEKFRAAIVLCYLEGKSQEEAALHMGCPIGTVRSRLARGRERLHKLLENRGLPLSATALAASFGANTASAAVSFRLVRATAKAALDYASGQAATALVSARVAALLEAGLKTMALVKLKTATVVAVMICLLGAGTGVFVTQLPAGPSQAIALPSATQSPNLLRWPEGNAQRQNDEKKPFVVHEDQAAKGEQKKMTLRGKVLETTGMPAAGVQLCLLGKQNQFVDLGKSGADGQFAAAVAVPKEGESQYVVARIDGAGLDFIRVPESAPADPIELRLVPDNAISGRVINTEGKPVFGAKVSVTEIHVYADNSLDSFLTAWKKSPYLLSGIKDLHAATESSLSTTTDADGRFSITGAGSERVVRLHFRCVGIADSELVVVNRPGFDPKPYNQAADEAGAAMYDVSNWMLSGPVLAPVAEAERIIRGVVKDIDSGNPRVGVKVLLGSGSTSDSDLLEVRLGGTTDADGRYEIRGARKAKSYTVQVDSDSSTGHLLCRVRFADKPGYDPLIADIGVKKGVIVTGRVIDAATKKPLPGFAVAGIVRDNPYVKKYPELWTYSFAATTSEADNGTFRLVTLPGPVVLMGGLSWKEMSYKPAAPDPKFPQFFDSVVKNGFHSPGELGVISILQGNFCKVLVLEPHAGVVTHDITVEPASALTVLIQDTDGNALNGVWATGMSPEDRTWPTQIAADSCSAYHLEGKPRLMVFWEPTKKLVGTLALKGDEKEPMVVKLGPAGSVKGRLHDENGKPLVGVSVDIDFSQRTASMIHEHAHRSALVQTDADGQFQLDNVIPGPKFSLEFRQGRKTYEPLAKIEDRSIQNGDRLDIGEVRLKLKAEEK